MAALSRGRSPDNVYQRGAAQLRGSQVPTTTTDERLLAGADGSDWVHSDPWRVLRIQSEFVEGFGALAETGPCISVFGSARTPRDSPVYDLGVAVGAAIARSGLGCITGGGPGAMEAANKGALEAGGVSIGLGIELPFEAGLNDYVDLGINFRYFFVRKTMFIKYAEGFIVLPGGMGTLDEVFEAITLVQTQKIRSFPIVLVGSDYWSGLIGWLGDTALSAGTIGEADLSLVRIVDDPQEAVAMVLGGARHTQRSARLPGRELHGTPEAES